MSSRQIIENLVPSAPANVCVSFAGEPFGEPLTWAEFAEINSDLGPELDEIKATIDRGEVYSGGGGADAPFQVKACTGLESDEAESWDDDKITRKIDQAYELAGCARQDRDKADELRWLARAKKLGEILQSRR